MGIITNIAAAIAVVALLLYGGAYLGLVVLGSYLTPSDEPEKVDAIVVLSGDSDRTEWGIKLYQEGWADKIVFSGAALDKKSPSNAAMMKKLALSFGVPESAILIEERATNTLENAEKSRQILEQIGAEKILLVTSPYHQRRAYETFVRIYQGDNLKIVNSPSGYSNWSAENWWERPASAEIAISELLKLLWSKLTGEFS